MKETKLVRVSQTYRSLQKAKMSIELSKRKIQSNLSKADQKLDFNSEEIAVKTLENQLKAIKTPRYSAATLKGFHCLIHTHLKSLCFP